MRSSAAGLLLALFISPAFPEDAVVVEATRFPEDVRRLPASVTVITSEDIEKSAARTLPEILSEQVGITERDLFGNNAAVTAIDMRGFGATGPQNTLVLLDGRRLSDIDLSTVQWSAIPLVSIERIEILRGTGGVLYGDGASAGVINIITRSALKQGLSASAFGRVATFNTREGQLYAGYGSQEFGINASVYGYSSDGYRANNRNEQQNNTLNLRWALGEGALDVRLGTDRQNLRLPGARRIRPSIGLDEFATDPRGTSTPLDFSSRDGQRAGATLLQKLGDVEFSLGLDYRDKDQRIFGQLGTFRTFRADDLDLKSLTPRLRVPFAAAGMQHRLTLGADWHDWRYRSRRTDRPETLNQPANRLSVTQKTAGFYLYDTIQLASSTVGTAGYRTERAKYDASDIVDLTSPGCSFCSGAPPVRQTQKQRAWELGIRQGLGANFAAFGRANRSFRFVNVDEIYEFSLVTFANQFDILRPQHAQTEEAGVEWRAGGNSLRAALFTSDVSDEIHLNPITFDNVNLPPSRRRGLELDGKWQALAALRLSAGYAYTDARFREGTLPGTTASIAGKAVPLVPRHKVNLGVLWDASAQTHLSFLATAVGRQVMENDESNTFPRRIPAYATADLKLTRDFGWGRLAFAVNNVLDKKYYNYAVNSTVSDQYNVYPLPGRTFAFTAEVALR
jgi:iron complex outermembrane receptor protein